MARSIPFGPVPSPKCIFRSRSLGEVSSPKFFVFNLSLPSKCCDSAFPGNCMFKFKVNVKTQSILACGFTFNLFYLGVEHPDIPHHGTLERIESYLCNPPATAEVHIRTTIQAIAMAGPLWCQFLLHSTSRIQVSQCQEPLNQKLTQICPR